MFIEILKLNYLLVILLGRIVLKCEAFVICEIVDRRHWHTED